MIMGNYDVQQVCINGHQITDSYNNSLEFRQDFCARCGAKTIHACPKCGAKIKGHYLVSGVISLRKTAVPSHCANCGVAFPWAKTKEKKTNSVSLSDVWSLIHPRIKKIAESRFQSGHHADAVEAALKEVNARVKKAWTDSGKPERDGPDLMFNAFDVQNPVIRFGDTRSQSGKSIQEGYKHLFAGAIMGIRNPKAHENLTIPEHRALQFLILASLLMEKLDEAETI